MANPEFVSVRQGDQIVSITASRAERLKLTPLKSEPATDSAGRPLAPRPAKTTTSSSSKGGSK